MAGPVHLLAADQAAACLARLPLPGRGGGTWRATPNQTSGSLFDMARVSAERAEEQTKSDDERSVLEEDAARYAGAWFRSRGSDD